MRSGRVEFERNVEAFGGFLGGADDLAGDALASGAVLEDDARFGRKALFHDDDGALRVDAEGEDVEGDGLALERDVEIGLDAQQDALAAAALFISHRLADDAANRGLGGNQIGFW